MKHQFFLKKGFAYPPKNPWFPNPYSKVTILPAEALMPFLEVMRGMGFDTEVIPAEKVEAAIPKWEKELAQRL